ncbi:immunoglobulin superfamily member 5-like isoform X1 [Solea senegalensis]|nr:immunoglobulin superfamily member 5 isoform X1 [Solea senegalensis]KAG7480134.1 immunoglobulin superfamily member 5-like isoform X1 [Solea senegalensis]
MVVHLLVLLLSLRIQALGAQLKLSPDTLTVLRGGEAQFTCSTSHTQWAVMVWLLNGTVALTISKVHGVLRSTNGNVTAKPGSDSKGDSWVFVLKNTERTDEGPVTCDLQGIERTSANLVVQEKGTVKVSGDNKLAFKGQSVLFECQAEGWHPEPRLQWQVNNKTVSQREYNISSEESGKSLFTVSSNLSVMAAKSSHVDCLASVSALPKPLQSGVRLTVVAEVVQEEHDCTVPLAVTGAVSAVLLLLLCISIILCYRQKRRANPSPQGTTWLDQSVFGRDLVAEATRGKVNLGYSSDGPTDADYNDLIMEIRRKMDFASFRRQAPDVVHSSSQSLHTEGQVQVCVSEENTEENAKNVRRITTV